MSSVNVSLPFFTWPEMSISLPLQEDNWSDYVWKVTKIFFCVILVFPLIYLVGQYLTGRCILWQPNPYSCNGEDIRSKCLSFVSKRGDNLDLRGYKEKPWQCTTLKINIDGHEIQGYLSQRLGSLSTRWTLITPGQGGWVERLLPTDSKQCLPGIYRRNPVPADNQILMGEFLDAINSNALLFNYPLEASRETLVKTYQLMLDYLANKQMATQIVGYGFSLGSLVQGAALETYAFKSGVEYCFIKHGAPSSIYAGARDGCFCGCLMGALAALFGWNLQSTSSSLRLEEEEITEILITPDNDPIASLAGDLKATSLLFQYKTFLAPQGFHKVRSFSIQDVALSVEEAFKKNFLQPMYS